MQNNIISFSESKKKRKGNTERTLEEFHNDYMVLLSMFRCGERYLSRNESASNDAEFWIHAFQECLHKQEALLDKECFRTTGKHLEEYKIT